MLRLKLIRKNDLEVVYDYLPEQGDKKGTVTLNITSGEVKNVVSADNDPTERYMHRAVSAIIKYYEMGKFPEEDVVAWY